MNLQTALALCLGLLLMALAPLSTAHLTQTTPSLLMTVADGGDATNTDGCRYLPAVNGNCVTNSGPSGNYFNAGNGLFAEAGSMPIGADLGALVGVKLFPAGWFGTGDVGARCDMEVLSDGNSLTPRDNALDENVVDGDGTGGGALPDGTIDDGGDGMVCHVSNYLNNGGGGLPDFDTTGCADSFNVSGVAHAEDRIFGGDVWLTAGCDWLSYLVDLGGSTICSLNNLIRGGDTGLATHCLVDVTVFGNSIVPVANTPVCGGDGASDALTYGRGGGDWPGLGVAYPTLTNGCAGSDATGSAAVMNSIQAPGPTAEPDVLAAQGCDLDLVQICLGSDPVTPVLNANLLTLHVNAYTVGWIDWSPWNAQAGWVDGGGIHSQI